MNYVIPDKYKIKTNHGSKGCQIKYFRNNYWYKLDTSCNEGKNEHIVSQILKCSNVKNFVYYEACQVNNKLACRSYNFLGENEMLITFSDIICTMTGKRKDEDVLWGIEDVNKRFIFLVDIVRKYTSGQLDISDYLRVIFYLDLFILNRDRHMNNLGIIVDISTGRYRCAPIFDNGLSLLGGCQESIFEYGLENTINSQNARTISGSFVKQALVSTNGQFNCPLKIDFKKLNKELKKDAALNKIQARVLEYQYNNIGKMYI